jgi:hypothetical protein
MKLVADFSELTKFVNNLNDVGRLEAVFNRIAKDIAKAMLRCMKSLTPVDEYELINGWNGNHFAVGRTENGFEVLIINKDPKAIWVNDGHKAYNQFGGAYPIKRRIQVRSPHKWQQGDPTWYVFGHFFVERGIEQFNRTQELEQIIMRELQKWWDSA